VEAPDTGRLLYVAVVAAHALVAAGAEGERPLAGEDDHADARILASAVEHVGQLDHGLRPECVAHLRAVDRDLRDPVGDLVADVLVVVSRPPVGRRADRAFFNPHAAPYDKPPWICGSTWRRASGPRGRLSMG